MQTKALVAAVILVSVFAPKALAAGFSEASIADNDPRELRLAAFQKYLEGDFEGAGVAYTRAIEVAEAAYGKDSTFVADLCYDVGTISLEDGQFQTAEKYLQRAVKQKPNSVMARVKYADLLTMRGNTGEAFTQIQQALKICPGSPVAQQAMVKWMMSQSNHNSAEGAIANVAATWESFRLRSMGMNSVQSTIASISNWKNGFLRAPAAKPQVKPAPAATVATVVIPKLEIKPKEATPPPPVKAKVKPAKIKPTERPITAIKIKPVEKPKTVVPDAPVEVAKQPVKIKPPAAKPVEKQVVASVPSKKKNGLVPPPPPGPAIMGNPYSMMVPPPPSGFLQPAINVTGQVKQPEKPKEKKKPKPAAAENDEDPDYLLDWAAKGKD